MPESVHSQDLDQSMVDAEQPTELPQSNDPILEERQIVVVRIWTTDIRIDATIDLWILNINIKKKEIKLIPLFPTAPRRHRNRRFIPVRRRRPHHGQCAAVRNYEEVSIYRACETRFDISYRMFSRKHWTPPPSGLGKTKNKNIITNY